MSNCRCCGSSISFTDREDGVCNSCLDIISNNIIIFSNLIGSNNREYLNYNQNAINTIINEEEEIKEYKKEVLGINKNRKAAK